MLQTVQEKNELNVDKNVFSVKLIKGHSAVWQHTLQGLRFYLDTLFLCVSSNMDDLSSTSTCLPYVYFWIQRPPGWTVNLHKWALAQLKRRGKKTTRIMESFFLYNNTLRMCVPVFPQLFVQLSHVQNICLDAFDAGWWESHQLFSESWSRTNGLNVWD